MNWTLLESILTVSLFDSCSMFMAKHFRNCPFRHNYILIRIKYFLSVFVFYNAPCHIKMEGKVSKALATEDVSSIITVLFERKTDKPWTFSRYFFLSLLEGWHLPTRYRFSKYEPRREWVLRIINLSIKFVVYKIVVHKCTKTASRSVAFRGCHLSMDWMISA